MAPVVGFVTQVTGVVRAVSTDGTIRVLVMGDPVHANETLETVGQNSSINVLFEDGRQIAMAANETSLIDDSVYSGQGYAASDVQVIQEALMQGQVLEEAAAGQEGPASDGGSGDLYVAERTGDLGDIGSYMLGTDGRDNGILVGAEDNNVNIAPVVFDTTLTQNEVLDGFNTLSGQLLVTDVNANDTHTFFAVEGSFSVTSPDGVAIEGLTFTFNPDGSYTISGDFNALSVGENAVVSFDYYAVDNLGATSQTATFTLTITGTNDRPVVSDVNANGETTPTVVDFENIDMAIEHNGEGYLTGSVPEGYSNIGWDGHVRIMTFKGQDVDYGGYDNGTTSGNSVIYNGWGISPTSFVFNETVTFNSTNLTSAWDSTQTITFQGFLDGVLVYTSEPITINNQTPTLIELNWSGINQLVVTNSGSQWVMDDFTYTLGSGQTFIYESADPQSGVEDVTTTFNGELPAVQDDDANDTHTYQLVEESLHVSNELVADLTVIVNADGTYTVQGNFNALAAGETATVTFQYVANDGRGFDGTDGINESSISAPATVTLTITGTNDQPVIADVTDTQNEALEGLNVFEGTLPEVQDDDANDTHTYNLVEESVEIDNAVITEYGVVVNEDGTYSITGDFNALAAGESATITFQYTATDSSTTQANGESNTSAPATVTFTITGTNDQPVVEDVTVTVTEASLLDTPREDSRYEGQLTVSDADASDTHTFSIDNGSYRVSITTVDSQGNETVTTLAPWAVGILMLTNQLSVELNAETGEYSVYSTLFNALGANQSMSVSFDYRANDGQGFSGDAVHGDSLSDAATATLVVQGTNDQPVAFPSNVSTWEALLANTPSKDAMFSGNLPFATDEDALDNLNLTYIGVDSDSDGVIDATTTGPVDGNGAPVVDPAQTVVVVNPNGSYTIINPTFNGLAAGESATVTFQYYVNDGANAVAGDNPHESSNSELQTVTLTIRGTNDRPVVEAINDAQDEALEGLNTFTGTLTATDADVNDTHTFQLRSGSVTSNNPSVTGLNVALLANGEYTVSGDFNALALGESAVVTFQYRANDGSGFSLLGESQYSSWQTVTLTITGTNDAPVVSDLSDTAGTATEAGVVTNDGITTPVEATVATGTLVATDVDNGAVLTWSGGETGVYGTFGVDANGDWTYTVDSTPGSLADQLAQGETVTETFTATVTDEHGATATQTVTITVVGTNDAPIAVAQENINVVEDSALIAGQLVANDIDSDDDATTLNYSLVGDAPAGFVLNSDGSYTFDPSDEAYQSLGVEETADVTFTWIATDSHGASSAPQTVTITVAGANDAPVATDDGRASFTFGTLTGHYYAVDSDDNGLSGSTYVNNNAYFIDNLTEFKHIVANTDPAATFEATKIWYGYGNSNGVSTGNSLQHFLDHDGASLEYTDGQTNTAEGGIHISGSVYIKAGTYNFKVLADDGYEILINGESVAKHENNQSPTTRVHGAFTIDADGWYDIEMYWWDQGGEYVFKPEISADGGLTYTALSNEDTYVTPEDTAITFQPEALLANDFDIDGDTLTIIGVSNPTNGTVVLNDDGTITFTPAANYNGEATFTYTISDGNGGEDSATVFLYVSPVNDAPAAMDDALETNEDTPLTIPVATLLANDSDVDGDTLTLTGVGNAANGTVVLNEDGTITFTPDHNFSGEATFEYTISDGNGGTDTATVTITVAPVADTPQLVMSLGQSSVHTVGANLIVNGSFEDISGIDSNGTTVGNSTISAGGLVYRLEIPGWKLTGGDANTTAPDISASGGLFPSVSTTTVGGQTYYGVSSLAGGGGNGIGNSESLTFDFNTATGAATFNLHGNNLNGARWKAYDSNGNEVSVQGSLVNGTLMLSASTAFESVVFSNTNNSGYYVHPTLSTHYMPAMEPHHQDHGGVGSTDGNNYMDLGASPGNSAIYQELNLSEGTHYLSFDYADKAWIAGAGEASGKMQVLWNGAVVLEIDGDNTQWLSSGLLAVVAVEGVNILTFKEIGAIDNHGIAIDNVQLHGGIEHTYTLTLMATLGDTSETLSPITIAKDTLPNGAILSGDGLTETDDAYVLTVQDGIEATLTLTSTTELSTAQINAITGSVTSIDGTSTATATALVFNEVDGTIGTDGNDIFKSFTGGLLDGGDGADMLLVEGGNIDLSGVSNIEYIQLTGGTEAITLTAADVFNLTDTNNVLVISGEGHVQIAVDALDNNEVWTKNDAASTPEQSVYEAVYNGDSIKLIIDQSVDTDIL